MARISVNQQGSCLLSNAAIPGRAKPELRRLAVTAVFIAHENLTKPDIKAAFTVGTCLVNVSVQRASAGCVPVEKC